MFGGKVRKVALFLLVLALTFSLTISNSKTVYASESDSTAHYLIGETYAYLIFVNLPGETFSSSEINNQIQNFEEARSWLINTSPVDAQLEGKFDYTYSTVDLDHDIPSHMTCGEWIDEAVIKMGFNNADQMAAYYKNQLNVNNFIMIFILPKKGRPYACVYPLVTGERAVIFRISEREEDGFEYPASFMNYVHEMLHLFGACDEYGDNRFIGDPCNCKSGIPPVCLDAVNCGECDVTHSSLRSLYPNKNCETCNIDPTESIMKNTLSSINNLPNSFDYYARGAIGWNDYDCDGTLDIFDSSNGPQCYPPIADVFPVDENFRNVVLNAEDIAVGNTFTFLSFVNNFGFDSNKCWLSFSMSDGIEWDSPTTEVRFDDGSTINFYDYPPGSTIQNRYGDQITSTYELLDIEIEPFKYNTYLKLKIGFKALDHGSQWIKWRLTCPVNGIDYYVNNPHKGNKWDQQGWEVFEEIVDVKQKYCSDGTAYGECSSTKPYYCNVGSLIHKCQDCGCPPNNNCEPDGTCKPIVQQCTPNSGPCCDSNGNYRSTNYICQANIDTEYGCAGSNCGDDVLIRNLNKYCSGSSSSCNGQTKWTDWDIADDCNQAEKCSAGNPSCSYNSQCDVSSNGNFYVSDYQNNKILRYSSTGAYLGQFGSCSNPRGVTWDGNYLWQVARANKKLCYFTSGGTYQGQIDIKMGTEPQGLTWDGEHFWITADTQNAIYKLDKNGNVLGSFSTNPPFASPRGLTWDGSYLWVTSINPHKIWKLKKEGTVVASCSLPSGATAPYGLTFDGEDVWVTDWATDKVYQIDTVISSSTCSVTSNFNTIDRPSGLAYKSNTQCSYGECCDNTGNYRSTSYKCQDDIEEEHGCPWGNSCGNNAGIRYKDKYCPGNNFVCTGQEVWEDWNVFDDCTEDEICSNGQCVYSTECACECTSGACCDGCNIQPDGSQPNGLDDYYDCEGSNSPTGTSYVRFNNYYCNGIDTEEHLSQTNIDACDTCKYCEAGNSECLIYDTSTVCGSQDCDILDTNCRKYNDVNKHCSLFGECEPQICNSFTNMPAETSCNNGKGECDENGFCIDFKYFNISLDKDWNLISFPLKLKDNLISEVFKNINFNSIFTQGSWLYYFNETHNNFNIINETKGYWIDSSQDQILEIKGKEFSSLEIPLNQEWNLIGYPYLTETDINNSNLKNYTLLTYINNSWLSYNPNRNYNSLQTLKPGYGCWLKK